MNKSVVVAAIAMALAGCGGGGDGSTTTYQVTGNKQDKSGNISLFTVCLKNAKYETPNSPEGLETTRVLAAFYGLIKPYQSIANEGNGVTCNPGDMEIDVDYYNKTILPTVRAMVTPTPTPPVNPTPIGPTPGPTPPPANTGTNVTIPDSGQSRGFINWNGSANGYIVLDANDEQFKFFADSRCIYSLNFKQETTNFCLIDNSGNANFAGLAVSVTSVKGAQGGCIAALTSGGYLVDIYTNGNTQTVRATNEKPNYC